MFWNVIPHLSLASRKLLVNKMLLPLTTDYEDMLEPPHVYTDKNSYSVNKLNN